VTVVLTTHFMDEAERLASVVHILDRGRLIASGSPAELTATGGETIRFRARPGLDTRSLAASLPPGASAGGTPDGRYEVRTDVTPDALATITAWCAKEDVLVGELTHGRQTLEDVFLELTGRGLRG
jgi:ABC-2 type transport system ATP-binding protein